LKAVRTMRQLRRGGPSTARRVVAVLIQLYAWVSFPAFISWPQCR
jgi:hypothetical protein